MPRASRTPRRLLAPTVLVCTTLLAASCSSGTPTSPASAARPAGMSAAAPADPAASSGPRPTDPSPTGSDAFEILLTIPVGVGADGVELAVEIRSVEAGGRRHVSIDAPDGLVDQHIVTEDEHWWWIPPMARPAIGDVDWIHIDLAEVESVGGVLPDVVLDARVPLPPPGGIPVGTPVAGHEVVAVERIGPDEDHLTLGGLDTVAVLRRRRLPRTTVVDLPEAAVQLHDLPEAVHPQLVPR